MRGETMTCPRTFQVEISEDDQIKLAGADCIKEECAMWDEEDGRCAIRSLMGDIRVISEAVRNIALKMPHADQFTK